MSQACDQCSSRKIKCNRRQPCDRCETSGSHCSFNRRLAKRGPPPRSKRMLASRRSEIIHQLPIDNRSDSSPLSDNFQQFLIPEVNDLRRKSTENMQSILDTFTDNYPLSFYDSIIPSTFGPVTVDVWPPTIQETAIMPLINTYFDRLYGSVPIADKEYILQRVLHGDHRFDNEFAAMLLSLCAFVLIQPVQSQERLEYRERVKRAREMINETLKLRPGVDLNESRNLDNVLCSFFLFACFFGLQQHKAAWFHLQEAVTLGEIQGLNNPSAYIGLPEQTAVHRLRVYFTLVITERAYAIQRGHIIGFRGKPCLYMRSMNCFNQLLDSTLAEQSNLENGLPSPKPVNSLSIMMHLFDEIDEDIVDCFNGKCRNQAGECKAMTAEKAVSLHKKLSAACRSVNRPYSGTMSMEGETVYPSENERADIQTTEWWLHNRLWYICLTHALLRASSPYPELTYYYAYEIARSALEPCSSLKMSSMEVHGIGIVEKLYDVSLSLFKVAPNLLSQGSPPNENGENLAVPLGPLLDETAISEVQNKYLTIMASFRGGMHPYLLPFIQEHENFLSHAQDIRFAECPTP